VSLVVLLRIAMNYSAFTPINMAPVGPLLIATMLLAGCGEIRPVGRDFGPPPMPGAAVTPLVALTPHEQAAQDCWLETEPGAKGLPLDKRAKLVDKCVKDKMSGAK
jgi:hypothetical protein